ncbi:MAG: mechanosensitive ion channel family protein [Nanoarchaeota archaeon]|nr:mechanosensitive ion channel family protein [Nanoarchaeota archaeon]MBU1321662.1 mechanosensitive ion channel family protein [Nanoarchaeota archaeon]MBU1596880.1 mechanosensitive ion channel family protein [Nanoarchaeota archaeon]MBU2442331.1 mechanosensitive ion channel family protein [Nanoarchaeota archaeon]
MAFLENILWGNTYSQYLILIISIILAIVIGKIFYWLSTRFIKVFTVKTKTKLDDIIIGLLEKPVVFLIIWAGLYYGLNQLTLAVKAQSTINNILMVLLALNITWLVVNLIDAFIVNYLKPKAEKTKSDLDDHLLPIIRTLVKIVIWIIVLVMMIKNFGYDVSALLTGVGLGGLAFALAAKDLLSNMFGGVAILTDKPFKIGDRVKIGSNDGWVTQIGLRTTRIKTLDGTQLVIPNSEIANGVLENISREKARKVKLNIGVVYGTPQKKMLEAEKILKDVVKKNKSTDDDSVVSFNEFGEFSLNILLIYWIKDLNKILETKHEVNLAIKDRFEKANISMAFPTRTLHVINEKSSRKKK